MSRQCILVGKIRSTVEQTATKERWEDLVNWDEIAQYKAILAQTVVQDMRDKILHNSRSRLNQLQIKVLYELDCVVYR